MKVPQSKRKFVSSLTDTSTKVVLSERNVEIKDLESKVKFLKNKMKVYFLLIYLSTIEISYIHTIMILSVRF